MAQKMNEKEAAGKSFNCSRGRRLRRPVKSNVAQKKRMAIKRKMPQTVVNAQNWRVPMKKKIGLMFLMLISLILVMGGTAFAVTCPVCGSSAVEMTGSYSSTKHSYYCHTSMETFYEDHKWKGWANYPDKSTTHHRNYCSVCNHYESEPHTYGDWSVTTAATCTTEGVQTHSCTVCGATESEPISAVGHSWNSGTVTTSPTCTTAGVRTYTCTRNSSHTYTETISATGHSYGSWQTYTSGTCQTPSVERRYCTNSGCGSYEERTGSYGNHNYSQSCPTCGTANVKCSICGDIKSHTCLQAPTVTMKLSDGTSYNETWTNKSVTVTLSATGATNYQYSTNGTTWQAITGLTMNGITGTVTYSDNMNSKMYFRTVKGSTYSGATSAHNIKIDKTAPSGTININKVYGKYVNSNEVTIKITFTDNYSTAYEMKIALINSADFSESKLNSSIVWEEYAETKSFTLTEGEGIRKVYAIFKDAAGNQSVYLVQ